MRKFVWTVVGVISAGVLLALVAIKWYQPAPPRFEMVPGLLGPVPASEYQTPPEQSKKQPATNLATQLDAAATQVEPELQVPAEPDELAVEPEQPAEPRQVYAYG